MQTNCQWNIYIIPTSFKENGNNNHLWINWTKRKTQIIDLMASNQSKVALIQKTSNLTNIQYSHHHHNYDYCRIQYRHQNYEFHYNNLQTKQFFHLTSHHSHTSSTSIDVATITQLP